MGWIWRIFQWCALFDIILILLVYSLWVYTKCFNVNAYFFLFYVYISLVPFDEHFLSSGTKSASCRERHYWSDTPDSLSTPDKPEHTDTLLITFLFLLMYKLFGYNLFNTKCCGCVAMAWIISCFLTLAFVSSLSKLVLMEDVLTHTDDVALCVVMMERWTFCTGWSMSLIFFCFYTDLKHIWRIMHKIIS